MNLLPAGFAITGGEFIRCKLLVADRIEINPAVMLGKPVIRGTRIPVELLLRKLGEGATEAHLLDAYPRLPRRTSARR